MSRRAFAIVLSLGLFSTAVLAADMPQYKLTIKDHKFEPAQITVPAGTKFKVLVSNRDGTPSEFESNDFNREKIVLPGSEITVFIGPLDKGRYKFFDDFHQDTGQGVLIVE
ncbi:MAG: cupredoxin domain-containing protein [Proteobacteria bacterium]|nr:cupredoxin domain-containing protein [Pseudomonadota bacterium]